MPTGNLLDILLEHDQWGTNQILRACAPLTSEQFHRRFEMGPGSLHDTITHMISGMGRWADVLAGREMRPRLDPTPRTVSELTVLLGTVGADLHQWARARPVDEIVSGVRDGKPYSLPRGVVVAHITTHGMHHRAQCLNMLRHLSVSPLPPSSVVEWSMASGKP